MKKMKLTSMTLCVLLITSAFSGVLPEMIKEVNGNTNFQLSDKCAFSGVGEMVDNWAITPALNLSEIFTYLTLRTKYEIKSDSEDFGFIWISSNGGDTWEILGSLQGPQPDWIEMRFDLGSWEGRNVLIAFEYTTGWNSFSEGWYVDSIAVSSPEGIVVYFENFEKYEIGDKFGDWLVIETQIEINHEVIDIGEDVTCFPFAIFADPQISDSDSAQLDKLQQAIDVIIDSYPDVRFIAVVGDTISGEHTTENGYQEEFEAVRDKLEELEAQSGIPYIPIIGNHDIWVNIDNYSGTPPEYLFAETFADQYKELEEKLAGWTKQDKTEMPSNNPYDWTLPAPYFQNFAFSYGPYRFICLDFCPRDDYKNADYHGYADLHDVDNSNSIIQGGTYQFLESELAISAKRGVKNIVILVHHPPDAITVYGYSQEDREKLAALLRQYKTDFDLVYYWFSGHRHASNPLLNRWNIDTIIENPPGGVTVPSLRQIYSDPTNINGCFAIVNAKVQNTGPDPSIYCQGDPDVPEPVTWDNWDVQLYENPSGGPSTWGPPISSNSLFSRTDYGVEVTLYNKGCNEARDVEVTLVWADYSIGSPPPERYTSGIEVWNGGWIPDNVSYIDLPTGAEGKVYFKWKSGEGYGDHFCLIVNLDSSTDINPRNNQGQENTNVSGSKGGTTKEISIPIGNPLDEFLRPQIEIIQHLKPGEDAWEVVEIYFPEMLPPYGTDTVVFTVSPSPDTHGQSREFSINLRDENGFLLGGVVMKVVSDAPPTLEWVGSQGYVTDGVEPDEGDAGTIFTFRVMYKDEDNDPPAPGHPLLYIFKGGEPMKGSPFPMEENSTDIDYTVGKTYTCSIALLEPGDDYTYCIWARDIQGVLAEGPSVNVTSGPKVFPRENQFLAGLFSTFNLHHDVVELYVRVVREDLSNMIYDIEIFKDAQQPPWDDIEVLEVPAGWNYKKIGNGVKFYTESNPLLACHRMKFMFRVEARRISWYIRIQPADQNHRNMGMIVSTRWWLHYYPV